MALTSDEHRYELVFAQMKVDMGEIDADGNPKFRLLPAPARLNVEMPGFSQSGVCW